MHRRDFAPAFFGCGLRQSRQGWLAAEETSPSPFRLRADQICDVDRDPGHVPGTWTLPHAPELGLDEGLPGPRRAPPMSYLKSYSTLTPTCRGGPSVAWNAEADALPPASYALLVRFRPYNPTLKFDPAGRNPMLAFTVT